MKFSREYGKMVGLHGKSGKEVQLNMKVLLTGATGAVGIALINRLLTAGAEMTVVCRPGSFRIENIPKSEHVTVIEKDISDLSELIDELKQKYDICYHMAWMGTTGRDRNDENLQKLNVSYAEKMVDVAYKLGCKRFIGIGSQAEYGRVDKQIDENTVAKPENEYGKAKLEACIKTKRKCEMLGMEHVWVRIFSVYGPYDREDSLVSSALLTLKKGDVLKTTKGEQIWDFLYSYDAAKALSLLINKGRSGEIYCLGNGSSMSLRNYIEIIRDCIKREYITREDNLTEPQILFGAVPYAKNQVMHLEVNISKIKEDTGFVPEYDFETGILETLKWINKCYED